MAKLVIGVSGGVVVETYSDVPVEVTLVDWDDEDAGVREHAARRFPCLTLDQIPADTAQLLSIAVDA